jgi:hypothetical protein
MDAHYLHLLRILYHESAAATKVFLVFRVFVVRCKIDDEDTTTQSKAGRYLFACFLSF